MPEPASVSTTSAAYDSMKDRWALSRTLMAGTKAMRAAAEQYLPRFDAESGTAYQNRLKRSVLTNVYRRAVRSLTGKVFSRPVSLGDDMPGEMEAWAEDIDLQGNHLNIFARRFFRAGLETGLTHILVEHPRISPGATLADERAQGARPYFCHLKAEDVIFARAAIIDGREVLTHLRIVETSTEAEGEFGEAEKVQIRVYDRLEGGVVTWRLFEEQAASEWVLVDDGMLSIPVIPLVTLYFDRTGFMTSELPLEDLAHLNVLHWQASSDHHNALTYARFPIVTALGLTEEELDNLVVGPNKVLKGTRAESKIAYLEHTGAAFGSSREELEDLLVAMDAMALEPMLPRSVGVQTATARALDEAQATSALQAWAMGSSDALERAFQIAAMYRAGMTAGSVDVNSDVSFGGDDAKDVDALLKMRVAGEISRETFFDELKRRRFISDAVDAEDEAEKISAEGPSMEDERFLEDDDGDDTVEAAE